MAKLLIIIGLVCVVAGLLWMYFPAAFNWFGKLPGDIHIRNGNSSFFFPLMSMLIISALLSLLMAFFNR